MGTANAFIHNFSDYSKLKNFRCKQNRLFGFSKGLFSSKLIYVRNLAKHVLENIQNT